MLRVAVTLAATHAELIREEEDSAVIEGDISLHETSPSMFLRRGMDLEDQQCVFSILIVFV